MPAPAAGAASFRDPSGRLYRTAHGLLRVIGPSGLADFEAFSASAAAARFTAKGHLAGTKRLSADEVQRLRDASDLGAIWADEVAAIVEHERIPFPSYPYEWPPEMLHAAGLLTLDLALAAFDEHLGLKDATPFNVLFRGPVPVFVDWLSVERRDAHDPTWLPYAQFVRTFLLPLLAWRAFGLSPEQVFLARRDGLEPEEVYRLASRARRLTPAMLAHATLPTWLGARAGRSDSTAFAPRRISDADRARFVLRAVFTRLRRALIRLAPGRSTSRWTGYMGDKTHYSEEAFARKEAFVKAALAETGARRVLDVGCNTGHFSAVAARMGAAVVALDGDPSVAGEVWRMAGAERLDVLPLVVNIARPSPGTGWRNAECPAFLDRATGSFDMVLMLAVLHHLLVTERVPLQDVVHLIADLTSDAAVVEFVAPADPMFRQLARGRDHLHAGLTPEVFEAACAERFHVVRCEHVPGATRRLYLLRSRG